MRIYSQDIGIQLGEVKCTMLITSSGKWQMTEGIEQPNQEKIRILGEKENYKYLAILEVDTINKQRRKKKLEKSISGEQENYLKPSIKDINTWAVPFVRYSGSFLKFTREELQQMDQRTRKLMTA